MSERAQIAPKNNCHIVGVNLKNEHNVENTFSVRKETNRISGSGLANKKQMPESWGEFED